MEIIKNVKPLAIASILALKPASAERLKKLEIDFPQREDDWIAAFSGDADLAEFGALMRAVNKPKAHDAARWLWARIDLDALPEVITSDDQTVKVVIPGDAREDDEERDLPIRQALVWFVLEEVMYFNGASAPNLADRLTSQWLATTEDSFQWSWKNAGEAMARWAIEQGWVNGEADEAGRHPITRQMARAKAHALRRVWKNAGAKHTFTPVQVMPYANGQAGGIPGVTKPLMKGWRDENVPEAIRLDADIQASVGMSISPVWQALAVQRAEGLSIDGIPTVDKNGQPISDYGRLQILKAKQAEAEAFVAAVELRPNQPTYFPPRYDAVGRGYAPGGSYGTQGEALFKAAWQFHASVALGDEGYKWAKVACARAWGVKHSSNAACLEAYERRIRPLLLGMEAEFGHAPTPADQALIGATAERFCDERGLGESPEAKKGEFWEVAGISLELLRIEQAIAAGTPHQKVVSSYVSHWDATNSGAQITALVMGDAELALMTNLLGSKWGDRLRDLYGEVGQEALAVLRSTDAGFDGAALAAKLALVVRAVFKQVVMLTLYGAGERTIKARCKEVVGSTWTDQELDQVLAAAAVAMARKAKGLSSLRRQIRARLKVVTRNNPGMDFTVPCPDGVVVRFKHSSNRHLLWKAGYSVLERPGAHHTDPRRTGTMATARMVQAMDAWLLRDMRWNLHQQGVQIVTIHDSVGCHFGNVEAMLHQARLSYASLAAYDLLGQVSQANGFAIPLQGMGGLIPAKAVLASKPLGA